MRLDLKSPILKIHYVFLAQPVLGPAYRLILKCAHFFGKYFRYIRHIILDREPRLNAIVIEKFLNTKDSVTSPALTSQSTALLHVAFHYNPARLGYLQQVLRQLEKLDLGYAEIVVDTNDARTQQFLKAKNLPGRTSLHRDLEHPFLLTWAHREGMRSRCAEFDFFVYLEDDIFIPQIALNRWFATKEALKREGFLPGFLRIEHDRNNQFVSSDFQHSVSDVDHLEIDGQYYCATPFPYQAFWIYDRETMAEFIASECYEHGFDEYRVTSRIRENAVFGYGYHSPPPGYKSRMLLPLLSKTTVHPGAFVFHLPSNYGRKIYQHPAGLGTVAVDKLFATNGGT